MSTIKAPATKSSQERTSFEEQLEDLQLPLLFFIAVHLYNSQISFIFLERAIDELYTISVRRLAWNLGGMRPPPLAHTSDEQHEH